MLPWNGSRLIFLAHCQKPRELTSLYSCLVTFSLNGLRYIQCPTRRPPLLQRSLWASSFVTSVYLVSFIATKELTLSQRCRWQRLAYLKRFFSGTNGTWKSYLQYIVTSVGGLFFFNCNYNISDYTTPSQFYQGLLLWWSQFHETFATEEEP